MRELFSMYKISQKCTFGQICQIVLNTLVVGVVKIALINSKYAVC